MKIITPEGRGESAPAADRKIIRVRRRMLFANEPTSGPPDPERMASFWHTDNPRAEGTLQWEHLGFGWYKVYGWEETSMGTFVRWVDPNVVFPRDKLVERPEVKRAVGRARRRYYAHQYLWPIFLGVLTGLFALAVLFELFA